MFSGSWNYDQYDDQCRGPSIEEKGHLVGYPTNRMVDGGKKWGGVIECDFSLFLTDFSRLRNSLIPY